MTHIDEHTLELYVLGDAKVEPSLTEIKAHLAECEGCKRIAERMQTFYVEAEKELQLHPETGDTAEKAIVRARTKVQPFYKQDAVAVPQYGVANLRPVTTMQRFTYFMRRHPAMIGSGTFAALAGLALVLNNPMKEMFADKNPSYHWYNTERDLVEIRNANNDVLWTFPSHDLKGIRDEEESLTIKRTIVSDIDGDGKDEVLTTVPMLDERNTDQIPFRVFGSEKNLRERAFDKPIRYLNRPYPESWCANGLLIIDSDIAGRKEILVKWGCGRSPIVIERLDANLKSLGEYWHFGHMVSMSVVDVFGDGKKDLVLTGQNDIQDSVSGEFPAIVILDPGRIAGAGKSVCSPGFHLPSSNAELMYVRLAQSSLATQSSAHERVTQVLRDLPVVITFGVHESSRYGFEYLFSRNMEIQSVKSTTAALDFYNMLVSQGKLSGRLDDAYLENLKNGVRYWDGMKWVNWAVKINHSLGVNK
jgi:hypothetical protein